MRSEVDEIARGLEEVRPSKSFLVESCRITNPAHQRLIFGNLVDEISEELEEEGEEAEEENGRT